MGSGKNVNAYFKFFCLAVAVKCSSVFSTKNELPHLKHATNGNPFPSNLRRANILSCNAVTRIDSGLIGADSGVLMPDRFNQLQYLWLLQYRVFLPHHYQPFASCSSPIFPQELPLLHYYQLLLALLSQHLELQYYYHLHLNLFRNIICGCRFLRCLLNNLCSLCFIYFFNNLLFFLCFYFRCNYWHCTGTGTGTGTASGSCSSSDFAASTSFVSSSSFGSSLSSLSSFCGIHLHFRRCHLIEMIEILLIRLHLILLD